jgi:hypothetical protein
MRANFSANLRGKARLAPHLRGALARLVDGSVVKQDVCLFAGAKMAAGLTLPSCPLGSSLAAGEDHSGKNLGKEVHGRPAECAKGWPDDATLPGSHQRSASQRSAPL